jgi:hypothetical protein
VRWSGCSIGYSGCKGTFSFRGCVSKVILGLVVSPVHIDDDYCTFGGVSKNQ